MIWYMSIQPAGDLHKAVTRILAQADRDKSILHLDLGPPGHRLYFCSSPEEAVAQKVSYEKYRQVSDTFCAMKLSEKGVTVSMAGTEDSQQSAAGFIKWVLSEFAPVRVYDSETKEDVSELAAVNPDALFG